jgi:hypothetical protein
MAGEDIYTIISSLGFPIAISIYLLITRDKIIQANTCALDKLSDLIEDMVNKK